MENQCLDIRKGLKSLIKSTGNKEISRRLKGLSGVIFRVQDSLLGAAWIDRLLESFSKFISLSHLSDEGLLHEVEVLEVSSLSYLIDSLALPAQTFQMILEDCKKNLKNTKITKLFPKFLEIYLKNRWFCNESLAREYFDSNILTFFRYFDIPYNHFCKSLAVKYLGDGNDLFFKLESLEQYLQLFFGNVKNYKFYVKVARIVESVNFLFRPEDQFSATYKIVLTSRSRNYPGVDGRLSLYSQYLMDASGIVRQGSRRDGIVIFGRHHDADLVFPDDDKSIDLAAFLIFHLRNGVVGIDISKNCYCSLKLQSGRSYELKPGQLLNFAKKELFLIKSIRFSDASQESNVLTNSTLTVENQEGLCQGTCYEFYTQTSNPSIKKLTHTIGCGSGGVSPDFFMSPSLGISKIHAQLTFDEASRTWSISDNVSTNGTYLLMKNFEQYSRKQYSSLVNIVENGLSHGVFMIEKNAFFISLE